MAFKVNNGYSQRLEQLSRVINSEPVKKKEVNNNSRDFSSILSEKLNNNDTKIKISSHAKKRLSERNIILSNTDISKLEGAMKRAEKKGSRDSLILYKDLAFITSIKNKTVITAIDKGSSNEEVFTNIDSAVIID